MLHQIVLCFLVFACHARSEVSQDSPVEQTIKTITSISNDSRVEAVEKMAKEFENLTIELYNAPKLNPNEDYLREVCDKNNRSEEYPKAMEAVKNFKKCFANITSYAELPAKIKKSKPYGELDTVFKEYCQKTDDMKACVHWFLLGVQPCLDPRQVQLRYMTEKITDSVLQFVCENEGDHIALFISEKGPDCILSKQEGIKKCVKDNFHDPKINPMLWEITQEVYYHTERFNFSTEKDIKILDDFDLAKCRMFHRVRKCIVLELQTCSGSTPANVVDSIFNLIHNETSCAGFKIQDLDPDYNSGSSLFSSIFSVILPALTVVLVRTFSS